MTSIRDIFLNWNEDENDSDILDSLRSHVGNELQVQRIGKNKAFVKYPSNQETTMEVIQTFLDKNKLIVLLITPCQWGKTGVITWTICDMINKVCDASIIPFPYIFVISGLLSNEWKNQTKDRMLPCIQENVWHNADLRNEDNKELLKKAIQSKYHSLIVIDEVHVGCGIDNTIYKVLNECHPDFGEREITQKEVFEYLHSQKVKLLFVSATPDCVKECMVDQWEPENYEIIRPSPSDYPDYVWHETYLNHGRVRNTRPLTDVIDGQPFHDEIIDRIKEYTKPLYHMIRLIPDRTSKNITKQQYTEALLLLENSIKRQNLNIKIITFDGSKMQNTKKSIVEQNIKNPGEIFEEWDNKKDKLKNMSPEDMLTKKPKVHVIFILKELLRVSQTMPINHIGLLVERFTECPNDSTLSQSLIGRACGHNKMEFINQILIYTNIESISRYVALWNSEFRYEAIPGISGYGVKPNKRNSVMNVECSLIGNKFNKKFIHVDMNEIHTNDIESGSDCESSEFSIDYPRLTNKEKLIYDKISEYMKNLNSKQWVGRGKVRKALRELMPEADYRDLTAMQKKSTNISCNYIIKKEGSQYKYKLC